jgi:steroid delta-isomerase-like uncharacterized protein
MLCSIAQLMSMGEITMNATRFDANAPFLPQQPAARRRFLGGLLAGSVTAVLAAPGVRSAVARSSTPATGATPPILQEWAEAWSEHDDGTQLAALYTDNGTHEEVPSGTVFSDPQAIAGYAQSHFLAFPDVMLELESAFAAGDRAAAEFVYAGTYEGSLPGLPPGGGQPFSLRGAAIFDLQDGRILHSASYFDFYGLLIQLGVLPAPGSAATPAA